MRFKSLLSGVVGVSVLTASLTGFAAGFSDTKGHWSEKYVDMMVKENYIKGYEDGTFKPDKTVSNTEALILLSRMLGVDDAENKMTVDNAVKAYSDSLAKYKTDYENEISYLLYRGVIDIEDLDTYISSSNKNKALYRYQCAMLLTKLMGADDEVSGNVAVSSSYADTAKIPAEARVYVEYVKDTKIMEGMGIDSAGDPIFGPMESVTRGQMAKMLSSLIDVLDIDTVNGVIEEVDEFDETITIDDKTYDVEADTIIKVDGEEAELADLSKDMEVAVYISRNKVSLIEAYSLEVDEEPIRRVVVSVSNNADGRVIVVSNPEDSSERETYTVSPDVKVIVEKAVDVFSKLKSNQYVEITLEKDIATQIEVISKNTNVIGTITDTDITSKTPTITVANKKGVETTYVCSSDGVEVTRNNATASLFDIVAGDSVTVKLVYDKVTKVTAESENQSFSGKIDAITHTTNGTSISFIIDGEEREFSVSSSAEISIDGSEGTVYDLRPGSNVTFKSESSKITKLETTQAASVNKVSGKVTSVQSKHNLLFVDNGDKEVTIIVDSSTNIANGLTGSTMKLSGIKVDAEVEITGSNATGVFVAKVIVVNQ